MSNGQGLARLHHLFVLMLENRSFDRMLGFSVITGKNAVTGQPSQVNGLAGTETNQWNGQPFCVSQPADFVMPVGPGHEFANVLHQLCGPSAVYPMGGAYPPINNNGFVASYAASGGQANPGEVMKCYAPGQLKVLSARPASSWSATIGTPPCRDRLGPIACLPRGLVRRA